MKNENEKLLKISELAEAAGVSVTTAKYYVKEGLVDIYCKTGRNMAYYAPESVERLKLIKALQSEKFYPLSVIKRLLRKGNMDIGELELMDAIHKADSWDYYESIGVYEAGREAGLKSGDVNELLKSGLISSKKKGKKLYCCKGDLRVMKLVKRRLDAGLPLKETIRAFLAYEEHIHIASRADVDSLVSQGLLAKPLDTMEIVKMIHVNDDTLDDFIAIKRYAYSAELGSAYIERVEKKLAILGKYGMEVCKAFAGAGFTEEAGAAKAALSGEECKDAMLALFAKLTRLSNQGIAATLAVCHKANGAFSAPFERNGDISDALREALRLGWKYTAAREFGSVDERAELQGLAELCTGKEELFGTLTKLLNEAGSSC